MAQAASGGDADKIWRALESARYSMLVDHFGGGLRARPMAHKTDRAQGVLWFVTSRDSAKVDEVSRTPEVCVTVSDSLENRFASVSGRAQLLDDEGQKRAIWTPAFDAYFPDGPQDQQALLLQVALQQGEYWDGVSAPLDAIQTVLSGVTGERPDLQAGAGQDHARSDL